MHTETATPVLQSSLRSAFIYVFHGGFLANWRLLLLGLTGLVLSLASGWTTYDGINNFTQTPILSVMITFGIQGVMLVTAWLIGESFATGATGEKTGRGQSAPSVMDVLRKASQLVVTILVLFFMAIIIAKYALDYDFTALQKTLSESLVAIVSILGAVLSFALCLVLFSRFDIIGPYARGMRIILAHLPLWLMFLACMATSVFFSFDSLFSTIFPEDERSRAGQLRAQKQITGIVADIDQRLSQRTAELSTALFQGQDWGRYQTALDTLQDLAKSAPPLIDKAALKNLKTERLAIAEQEQSLSDAQAQKQNLDIERKQRIATLERLEAEKPKLEQEVLSLESKSRQLQNLLAERRAEARAEAKGVGASGREGRGPKYRALQKQVTKLQIDLDTTTTQLRAAQQALDVITQRRDFERTQLLEIERKIGGFQIEATSAQQTLDVQQQLRVSGNALKADVSQQIVLLTQSLSDFRQTPNQQSLTQLQNACARLSQTLGQIESLKPQTAVLNCDPRQLGENASALFAVQQGRQRYSQACGQGAEMSRNENSIDALLDFGYRCIVISGLPSADTQQFRQDLSRIALNRDDKAHRFVVTWNAFSDGNQLAYLALSIAIAIDCLVFMSGLFGASAVVSPLSESPHAKSRPVAKLEQIIDNALLPDRAYAAELALNVMNPRFDKDNTGFIATIDLQNVDPQQGFTIKKVLTAGASLGFIKHDEDNMQAFHVRAELFEHLSAVAADEAKRGRSAGARAMPKYQNSELRISTETASHDQGDAIERIENIEPKVISSAQADSDLADNAISDLQPVPLSAMSRDDVAALESAHSIRTVLEKASPKSASYERAAVQEAKPVAQHTSSLNAIPSVTAQKVISLPAHEITPQLSYQPDLAYEDKIQSTFLSALGLSEIEFDQINADYIPDNMEEWQSRVDNIQRNDFKLYQRIEETRNVIMRKLQEAQDRLTRHFRGHDQALDYLETTVEDLSHKIPDITIWKAYQESKKSYRKIFEFIDMFEHKIKMADEAKKDKINSLITCLEEAEQKKLDGWLELEDTTQKLIPILAALGEEHDEVG